MRPLAASFLLLAVTLGAALAAETRPVAQVPEPRGYWLGPVHGPVPATITGGTVVRTAALADLLARGGTILVDVGQPPRRPPGLPPGTLWMTPLHRGIPGSVWMPGVGRGAIPPDFAAWFRARLAALTGGNRHRRVVFYCHPDCWMSWNAARRAIHDGYREVFWYPEGLEGWQAAGHDTVVTKAEGPAAR